MGVFHSRDGLCFERRDNGDVVVTLEQPVRDAGGQFTGSRTVTMRVQLASHEWASVVSSVSHHGEDINTWQHAFDFHEGIDRSER